MEEVISHFAMCLFACIIVHFGMHLVHDHNHSQEEQLKEATKRLK